MILNKCVLLILVLGIVLVPDDINGAKTKGSTKKRKITRKKRTLLTRTTPERVSFKEDCDYLAYYCMKAYDTGRVCARTVYQVHHDFINYCMVDYVNCMERYEVWQIAHMGECIKMVPLADYRHYPYENDYFLDDYYIVEDLI